MTCINGVKQIALLEETNKTTAERMSGRRPADRETFIPCSLPYQRNGLARIRPVSPPSQLISAADRLDTDSTDPVTMDETLIELVRSYPLLYDPSDPAYYDNKRKDNAWRKIAEHFDSMTGKPTVATTRKKPIFNDRETQTRVFGTFYTTVCTLGS